MKKILPLLFFIALLRAAEVPRPNGGQSLQKSSIREWKFFDVNSIYCTINSAGPYADYLRTNSSGLFWPKGTSKTAVYTSGLWIVGKHRQTGALRTAVQQYSTEFQPGVITGVFNTSTNDISVASDPNSTHHRIYKINKGDNAANNADYAEWPGDLGAPFNDINNNGQWDKGIDTPKLTGDQTLWCVYNDLDTALHRLVGTTPPMGVEVHAMYYGYNSPGPLGNTMFIQWKIINKSDAYYDSLFFGLFSDLELGDANDDINGYDTTLHLAYVYNADDFDAGSSGYGSNPPACGTVFLGGKPDLKPYAHPMYLKSLAPYSDAPQGNPAFPNHAYNFLLGKNSVGGDNINPITNLPDRFAFSGDPITNSGWTFLASGIMPRDIRSLLSVGPVTLSPGDTQTVDAAFVIAQGSDRLESFKRLRESALFLQELYEHSIEFPSMSIVPEISADSAMYTFTVDGNSVDASAITIECFAEHSNTLIASISLNDDGNYGDNTSGDGIFTATTAFPVSTTALRIDAIITDRNYKIRRWPQVARNIPLSSLFITGLTIFSDDQTQDGLVQPGENIRFGLSLSNPHAHSYGNVVIQIKNESFVPNIRFNEIKKYETVSIPYSPSQTTSYLSLTVPKNAQGSTYTTYVTIIDSMGNQWDDSVVFPLSHLIRRISTYQKVSGHSSMEFSVRITDKEIIKNHLYTISGVDSGYRLIGLQIRDSTASTAVSGLIRISHLTSLLSLNHEIPQTDGFKINIDSYEFNSSISKYYQNDWEWFLSSFTAPAQYLLPRSHVHYGDIPSVEFHFPPLYPYDATMPYGRFWYSTGTSSLLIPRSYSIWNNPRTQRAFLYSASYGYLGFVSIPFTVFDITADPPVQLSVVLFRKGTTSTTPEWITRYDAIYIMSAPYNVNGVAYDSSKGGKNLQSALVTSDTLSYYFTGTISPFREPTEDTANFILRYYPSLSSRDVYVFNPTEYFVELPVLPVSPQISQNYPNPFNPSTVIMYSLVNRSPAIIEVYDILGRRVRTLLNEVRDAGTYEIEWNGRNESGIPVSSGLYLYRFSSEGTNIVKKMMLIK
jgi:hypothetical protein